MKKLMSSGESSEHGSQKQHRHDTVGDLSHVIRLKSLISLLKSSLWMLSSKMWFGNSPVYLHLKWDPVTADINACELFE